VAGTWPDLAEVKAQLRMTTDASDDALIQSALDAAIDYCTRSCDPRALVEPIPDAIHEAALLLASRYYRRRDSIDGTIGWGDTGVVRVPGRDPDVDALLRLYPVIALG
jgi:hypothetical protein